MTTLTLTGLPDITPNKYLRWYISIITNRITLGEFEGYGENHHIIPKSLGGDNSSSNIVKLTAREHFICHVLLTKFTAGDSNIKMRFALKSMEMVNSDTSDRHISSWAFKYMREEFSKALSIYLRKHSAFKRADVHKKCMETRRSNNSNVFITNNPMLNGDYKALKVAKTSGDLHYTKTKQCYFNVITKECKYFNIKPEGNDWIKQGNLKGRTTKAKGKKKSRIICPHCMFSFPHHTLSRHIKAHHENNKN